MITADAVIRKRLLELNLENNTLAVEHMELTKRLQDIDNRLLEIKVEEEIMEAYKDRGAITTTVTTTSVTVTGKKHDKLMLDDALKTIFDAEGKPLKLAYVIQELERFDISWNRYVSAQAAISKLLEPTGAHGYYNFRR